MPLESDISALAPKRNNLRSKDWFRSVLVKLSRSPVPLEFEQSKSPLVGRLKMPSNHLTTASAEDAAKHSRSSSSNPDFLVAAKSFADKNAFNKKHLHGKKDLL